MRTSGQDHGPQGFEFFLPGSPFILGQGRPQVLLKKTADQDVEDEHEPQQDPRDDAAGKEGADGFPGKEAVEDEGDAGRNQDPQGPAGADAADGDVLVVAPLQHGGQGDEPHAHRGRPADPDHGGEDHADDHRPHGQATPDPAEPAVHHFIKGLGQPRLFEDDAHEDKKGNGDENEILHDPEAVG